MKEIQISAGKVAIVDDEDFDSLAKFRWQSSKSKNTWYAKRDIGRRHKREYFIMHRIIMKAQHGDIVDHKNGNGLDNRKENLRICTPMENARNSVKRKSKCLSRFKGVTYIEQLEVRTRSGGRIATYHYKYFMAQIRYDGRNHIIGRFKTEEEAARAYNKMAILKHGDFASINTI